MRNLDLFPISNTEVYKEKLHQIFPSQFKINDIYYRHFSFGTRVYLITKIDHRRQGKADEKFFVNFLVTNVNDKHSWLISRTFTKFEAFQFSIGMRNGVQM